MTTIPKKRGARPTEVAPAPASAPMHAALLAASLLAIAPAAAAGQLTSASAAELGLGGSPVATARGVTAIATNPAGLPHGPGFSLSIVPVTAQSGLDPVTLADLADWSGEVIPASVRSGWLDRIAAEGGQSGRVDVGVGGIALTAGSFGFQFSVLGSADLLLNADGAELVLFGNAGRTGQARDFQLAGSRIDGFAVSTAALSWGFRPTSRLSIGLTGKLHTGHAFIASRDGGSVITSDPVDVSLRFPTLATLEDSDGTDGGSGFGLDLGARYVQGWFTFGASIRNVVNTFEWDMSSLGYRPGSALFDGSETSSDFDERPASAAPAELQRVAEEATFAPEVAFGLAWDGLIDSRVTVDLRTRIGDGLDLGPKFYAGVGYEYQGVGFLPIRLHAARITDGFQFGGGASIVLGPVHLSYGMAARAGDLDDSVLAAASITIGGH